VPELIARCFIRRVKFLLEHPRGVFEPVHICRTGLLAEIVIALCADDNEVSIDRDCAAELIAALSIRRPALLEINPMDSVEMEKIDSAATAIHGVIWRTDNREITGNRHGGSKAIACRIVGKDKLGKLAKLEVRLCRR